MAEKRVTVRNPDLLATGDTISYTPEDVPEPPVDLNCTIVHEDELIAVINKSGDIPCHPGGRYFNNTLWALLKEKHGIAEPGFVNRLDRETSGLVLVAKTRAAEKNLRSQFAQHLVSKSYIAFVSGITTDPRTVIGELGPDSASLIRKKQKFTLCDDGTSQTSWETLAVHHDITELKVTPKTGRLHQIRATLLACGLPIVGDKLYGPDETRFLRFCRGELTANDLAELRLPRQALHAVELSFRHPAYGRPTTFTAPLPDDLRSLQIQEKQ